jgi:UDP-glucose 4-epimerase
MKVLVTGGAGFIASNLTDRLIELGHSVVVIDNLSTGKLDNVNPKAEFINKCLTNLEEDFLIGRGIDVVFHLAALARVQPSIKDPINFNEHNVTGTLKLLYASYKAKVKRVVYSASSSAYGNATIFPTPETHPINPLSPYGLQKLIGEQYCKVFSEVYGLDTCSLRYFNIYGERMNLDGAYCLAIGIFAKQMLEGKPLTITNDGNQRRDFTYVQDVVDANILAATLDTPLKGEVFNIGNGNNYSINEVADMLGGTKTYGVKVLEPFQTLADNTKAREILGWDPKGDLPKWIIQYKKDLGI